MLARRMMTLLLVGASLAFGGAAMGQGKVIVYTSNDSNLNRFVFEAFKKETGIEVEQVEAGSGVVFRRIQSERERPLGDIVWGVSRRCCAPTRRCSRPMRRRTTTRCRRISATPTTIGSAPTCTCW